MTAGCFCGIQYLLNEINISLKKQTYLLLIFITITQLLSAQHTKVYIGLGGIYNSFQDSRFSDVQFNKVSIKPEIGFTRISDKDYWLANAGFYLFENGFPGYDTIKIKTLGYNVSFGYLRNIKPGFYLGGTWNVLDYMSRDNSMLGNNANFYILSSDLFISAKYLYAFSDNWSLDIGLDYGLISLINTAPSFTANFPQNVVDNGEVSFLDSDTRNPYNFKNMEAKVFWDQFYFRTYVKVNFKRRLSLIYNWDMRTYADTKGYPVTNAMHSLILRFHFISHTKKK